MAKLIYATNASLDGYIEDDSGNIDFTTPNDEVFTFWTDFERTIGTYLYGRRLYKSMVYWETAGTSAGQPEGVLEFAQTWRAAEKVVYSRTLQTVSR